MKRLAALLLTLAVLFLATACGSNSKGVSKEQVHTDLVENGYSLLSSININAEVIDSIDYSISHDIDRNTHTDAATVIVTTKSKYGTHTRTLIMYYQYYKSDDLWELVNIDDVSCHFDVNPESFIGTWADTETDNYTNRTKELYLNIYDFDGHTANACFLEFSDRGSKELFRDIMTIEYCEYENAAYLCFADEPQIELGICGVTYLSDEMSFIPF